MGLSIIHRAGAATWASFIARGDHSSSSSASPPAGSLGAAVHPLGVSPAVDLAPTCPTSNWILFNTRLASLARSSGLESRASVRNVRSSSGAPGVFLGPPGPAWLYLHSSPHQQALFIQSRQGFCLSAARCSGVSAGEPGLLGPLPLAFALAPGAASSISTSAPGAANLRSLGRTWSLYLHL